MVIYLCLIVWETFSVLSWRAQCLQQSSAQSDCWKMQLSVITMTSTPPPFLPLKVYEQSWARHCIYLMTALGTLRLVDCESDPSLVYSASSRPVSYTVKPYLKQIHKPTNQAQIMSRCWRDGSLMVKTQIGFLVPTPVGLQQPVTPDPRDLFWRARARMHATVKSK